MHQCPREDITFHVTQHSLGLMPLLDLNFTELSPLILSGNKDLNILWRKHCFSSNKSVHSRYIKIKAKKNNLQSVIRTIFVQSIQSGQRGPNPSLYLFSPFWNFAHLLVMSFALQLSSFKLVKKAAATSTNVLKPTLLNKDQDLPYG